MCRSLLNNPQIQLNFPVTLKPNMGAWTYPSQGWIKEANSFWESPFLPSVFPPPSQASSNYPGPWGDFEERSHKLEGSTDRQEPRRLPYFSSMATYGLLCERKINFCLGPQIVLMSWCAAEPNLNCLSAHGNTQQIFERDAQSTEQPQRKWTLQGGGCHGNRKTPGFPWALGG